MTDTLRPMCLMQIYDVVERFGVDGSASLIVYGRSELNAPVSVQVHDIPIYLYFPIPGPSYDTVRLHESLNSDLMRSVIECRTWGCPCGGDKYGINREPCPRKRKRPGRAVLEVVAVSRFGFEGYEDAMRPFARIRLSHPCFLKAAEQRLMNVHMPKEIPLRFRGISHNLKTVTSCFLHGLGVAGFGWIQYPAGGDAGVQFADVKAMPEMDVGGTRAVELYFSVQTLSNGEYESELAAAEYPVAAISCVVKSSDGAVTANTFMLRMPGVADTPRADTIYFRRECEMLMAFRQFVLRTDPDLVFVYQVGMPYLLKRAAGLKLTQFPLMSRIKTEPVLVREYMKSRGKHDGETATVVVDCPGRIFYDVYGACSDNPALTEYGIEAVAAHLGLSVAELPTESIWARFHDTPSSRAEFAGYVDARAALIHAISTAMDLVPRLMLKTNLAYVIARDTLSRGTGYLLLNALIHTMADEYVLMNHQQTENTLHPAFGRIDGYEALHSGAVSGHGYTGGTVLEPKLGLHDNAVLLFDFCGMYSNIQIEYNICRSTQLPRVMPDIEHTVSPAGFAYARSTVRVGVLPRLLMRLSDERKAVQVEMTHAEGMRRVMLDAKQRELKIMMSAVSGQMGMLGGPISLLSGARSITAYGGMYITTMRDALNAAEEFRSLGLGVVAGDTDSLFCGLKNVKTLDGIDQVGARIARWVNEECGILGGRLSMAFQTAYLRFFSVSKKHYVGCMRSRDGSRLQLEVKGLETRAMTRHAINCQHQLLEMAMIDCASPEQIRDAAQEMFAELLAGRVDPLLLKLTTRLTRAVEAYTTNDTHVRVARQLIAANRTVTVGARMGYYLCEVPEGWETGSDADRAIADVLMEVYHQLHHETYALKMEGLFKRTVAYFLPGRSEHERLACLAELVGCVGSGGRGKRTVAVSAMGQDETARMVMDAFGFQVPVIAPRQRQNKVMRRVQQASVTEVFKNTD